MATRKRVLRTLAGTAPDSRRSVPPPTAKAEPPPASLVIVGIGASAGGLEAIEQFLAHTPLHQDLALVVVQHLGPEQKDLLVELLQRKTQMTVQQVVDGTQVEPDHVYVIPPGKELSILHGTLHLLDPLEPRGLRLPIDAFFRALADDLREASIGVVLSGMGSDGTLGLRAIKEHGGLTMVQEPGSAAFDGMPKSAIATGVADVVAPPDQLALRLVATQVHARGQREPVVGVDEPAAGGLSKLLVVLRARSGHDFSGYKKSTVQRRVERRMSIHQIGRIDTYVRFLRENPQEADLLFRELLVGVTQFFRDPPLWQMLRDRALPELLPGADQRRGLRAWVIGCSTGEEAYSLAIAFREALEATRPQRSCTLQIFATDLDPDAITVARQGVYPANIAADVDSTRLQRYFSEEHGRYRVRREIREMVTFATHNVIQDAPFTRLDVVCCRNLLIYLTADLQQKLLPLFHYALNPGGLLVLGNAETLGAHARLFAPLDAKLRLFRRREDIEPPPVMDIPLPYRTPDLPARADAPPSAAAANAGSLQALADQLVLQRFSPATVLVNDRGDIVYVSGRTGKYLEPAAGKVSWSVLAMAREGLREPLAHALHEVVRRPGDVTVHGLAVATETGARSVDVIVHAVTTPAELAGMVLIAFVDAAVVPVAPSGRAQRRRKGNSPIAEVERMLGAVQDENRTLREAMQSSHEELRSTNEELQSSNEELQSINEELTTSKEEMQSLNEELQTVNAELQAKVDELSRTSSDMANLLNSTDIATIFLDGRLHVRRFTNQAGKVFKLLPVDVGRPLADIVSDLDYPSLLVDAAEVLRTLAFTTTEVPTRDGRWFRARIMPYRTLDNTIDGVVMTFTETTEAKLLEFELRRLGPRDRG